MLRPHGVPIARGRLAVFVVWQLPTLALTLLVVFAMWSTSAVEHPIRTLVGPVVILAVATFALLMVSWETWGSRGRAVVPLADVGGLVLLELEGVMLVPAVALLTILPLVWLGFEFAWAGVIAAIGSGAVVGGYSYLHNGPLPDSHLEWIETLLLPMVALSLIVVAQVVSSMLRRNRARLLEQTAELAEALQASEDQVTVGQGVLDTVGAAVWFYGESGKLQLSNALAGSFAHLGGFHLEEGPFSGEHVWTADRTRRIPPEDQLVPSAFREERVDSHLEWWGPVGRQVALVVGAQRVRRDDQTPLGTVVAAWDITDLVESLRVREEFLATVSHELRTPLTSIMGYLELAQDAIEPNAPAQTSLEVVDRSAHTLLDRISSLLDANRNADEDIKPVSQEVGPIVAAVVLRHRPAAAAAGVSLTADIPAGVTGRVDAARFDQVVDNLLSNAIKYTPADRSIWVGLQNEGTGFILTVADSGLGMTEVERRQAFDRFFRTSSARDSATQGIGVGLSIVREIVRAHGGVIRLEGELGQGTRAIVTIPHTQPEETSLTGISLSGLEAVRDLRSL